MKLSYLSKKPVKVILWLSLIGFVVELFGYSYGLQLSDVAYHHFFYKKDKAYLSDHYGIEFPSELIVKNYPASWRRRPSLADQTEVVTSKRYSQASCLRTLKKEIKKLPADLIRKNLNEVYCLDRLINEGTPSAGTYSLDKKSIYIAKKSSSGRYYPKWSLRETFHHELSSFFKKNYHFDQAIWRAAHGDGFQYEIDKDPTFTWFILNGYVDPIDKEILYNRGLLQHYSETGVENDYNNYAEMVFVRPFEMYRLTKKYPIIKRKYEIFKDFYLSIDEGFAPFFDSVEVWDLIFNR